MPDPQIRQLTAADLPALMRLKESAGWNQTEDDWLRLLRLTPEGCFGVELDAKLAASTTVMNYGGDLAWVGMVLTLPQYRGRGFARRLLGHALGCVPPGCPVRLDATDMGRGLYESFGFVAEYPVERWVRAEPGVEMILDAARTSAYATELDREVYGADRSALLYSLQGRCIPGEGFAMSRLGTLGSYFGPCLARSPAAARALLRGLPAMVWDLFPDNQDAVRLAHEAGFAPARRLMRMVLNAKPCSKPDARIYAIAGFEWG